MVERSLRASPQGIKSAETALIGFRLTQQQLADALEVTRQPISKFFNGKPVACELFVRICEKLKLDWQAIAHKDDELEGKQNHNEGSDIDALVQEIREKVKPNIREWCGTMRVLDMSQPIELTGERGIYTNVNILEKITGRRRLDIPELLHNCDSEDFERFGLNRVTEERVPGLTAVQRYSKLMVLGKPGAGKTTFLKYLAMQCIEGQFQANQVPFFITLKDFAEKSKQPDLPEYIAQQFSSCGVMDGSIKAEQLLRHGRGLLLLDGLDEVREEDTKRVLTQIRDLADQFHSNQFVITCRIAAKDYTFERFTEVEVADFDPEQIAIFVQNWFRLSDPVKAERFSQKLKENKPIQELATNPLLLTLLCLVFGENADFPANRSELYKEGLDVLLKKWDAKRNIERDQVYKNLSVQRKEDLLSQIALTTFEQKDYLFKQKTVEAYIADFIRNLRDADPDPEVLQLDSEAVLKSIEAQHGLLVERAKGIYSFSHLTFQEYFAAREIKERSALKSLVEHITEKRWREVFLLTASMMRKADNLLRLMKQKIDRLIATDEKLQQLLEWLSQKTRSLGVSYKSVALRAFYFVRASDLTLARTLDPTIYPDIEYVRKLTDDLAEALDRALKWDTYATYQTLAHELEQAVARDLALDRALNLALDQKVGYLDWALATVGDAELEFRLQKLKDQLPDLTKKESLESWWQINGQTWTKQLRAAMIHYRNIGHEWHFSDAQKQLLQQYYDANKLLVDCLNSDCYV
ncbi:MAG TPA: signal transduction protein, partial [Cyanobacteria bacterium UBA12227]|nr:signal transduction protein [Cyanobacteria bacterium UBA12227]